MAYLARTITPADGATDLFPVSFPLAPVQGREGVAVYVYSPTDLSDGTPKVEGVDFSWISDGQISFLGGHRPAGGLIVDVRRETDIQALDNTIQSGGSLKANELVQNDKQLLYLAQEVGDKVQDATVGTLRAPRGETLALLPPLAARAGKFLGFGGDGNPLALEQDGMFDLMVDARQYGADGGSADVGAAIMRIIDAGYKAAYLRYANHLSRTHVDFPPFFRLISDQGAVITKDANIDLFNMSEEGTQLIGLTIQGAGASRTGRGAVLNAGSNSYDQRFIATRFLDFEGHCVEFVGADAAQRCLMFDSGFLCTDPTKPAVQMPGATDVLGGNRKLIACSSIGGGTLVDLGYSANTGMSQCDMVNMIFGPNSSRARIIGSRVAALGGTLVVNGYDNVFVGEVLAGNIQIAAEAQRCCVGIGTILAGGTITDVSVATGDNVNIVYDPNGLSLVPVLGATAGTPPTLGNGTATCFLERQGKNYTIHGSVKWGSTSTFGNGGGDYTISLPAPYNRLAKFAGHGSATATDVSAGVYYDGVARIAPGTNFIVIRNRGAGLGFKNLVPFTWDVNDELEFTITFPIGG